MNDLKQAQDFFAHDVYATDVTGVEITAVDENYAKVELDIDERHINAAGNLMGGVLFTMADFAFAAATNDPEHLCVTQSSQISYLSAVRGKHLIAEAHMLKEGGHTNYYQIDIRDELGTRVATVITLGYKMYSRH
ncbi:MAG: PaaI family thioesterase [Anaerovoracaceae bacterium]|jgi:acyl-CoA thioesterase